MIFQLDRSWVMPLPFFGDDRKDEECWSLALEALVSAVNQMTYLLCILVLNINNNTFCAIHTAVSLFQFIEVAYTIDFIFGHVVWTTLVYQGFAFLFGYINIFKSKMHFITTKKLERMVKEQYQIVKNLPDGALIHRQKITESENNRPENYVLSTAPVDT